MEEAKTVRKETPASETRAQLVAAAASEFNSVGFYGTNTNLIAKLAGFAPQTFYRHFDDKADVFIATYEQWQAQEHEAVGRASRAEGAAESIARAVLAHHCKWRVFRRSLRLLAIENAKVRAARAKSRYDQIQRLSLLQGNADRSSVILVADLLGLERLADAAADGEFADLGISEEDALEMAVGLVRRLRGENAPL